VSVTRLDAELQRRLEALQSAGLLRRERVVEESEYGVACSNLYLGPNGFGSGASRLISGTRPLHKTFEERVATWLGTPSALLFNSGTQANLGTISALVGKDDAVFSDQLNHASLIDGVRLSRGERHVFPHNDVSALRRMLESCGAPGLKLIVTEGIFSMDGDSAPLADLVDVAEQHGASLMVDEAHAVGVLGSEGQGAAEEAGVASRVAIRVGTCGKAMGGFGAFVAGSEVLREYLFNRARAFVFTTALPTAVIEANLAGLERVRAPEGRAKLWQNIERIASGLRAAGWLRIAPDGAIFPIVVGTEDAALALASAVEMRGFLVTAIRPPTVPPGTSRLRLTASSDYDAAFIDDLVRAIVESAAELGITPPEHAHG
jgi:glycine C-acetyltransferase